MSFVRISINEAFNFMVVTLFTFVFCSIKLEILRDLVPLEDPTKCEDALEWDATTLEQFKRSHTWTDGKT